MAHGENAAKVHGGKDYWKKRGVYKATKMGMASVSHNPGVNKKTKRITLKCERQQAKRVMREEAEEAKRHE